MSLRSADVNSLETERLLTPFLGRLIPLTPLAVALALYIEPDLTREAEPPCPVHRTDPATWSRPVLDPSEQQPYQASSISL